MFGIGKHNLSVLEKSISKQKKNDRSTPMRTQRSLRELNPLCLGDDRCIARNPWSRSAPPVYQCCNAIQHVKTKLHNLRYPKEPSAHAALGYFLLSEHGSGGSDADLQTTLDRATAAFRLARNASSRDNIFVPATRGLAVALRRRYLSKQNVGGTQTSIREAVDDCRRDDKVRTKRG